MDNETRKDVTVSKINTFGAWRKYSEAWKSGDVTVSDIWKAGANGMLTELIERGFVNESCLMKHAIFNIREEVSDILEGK